jgi:hypothetical protein
MTAFDPNDSSPQDISFIKVCYSLLAWMREYARFTQIAQEIWKKIL